MSVDYEIRPYTAADKDGIARLQCRLWSPDVALNRAHFEWKYEHTAGMPLVFVAVHAGCVVAMRGLLGTWWEADGLDAPEAVYCADDLAVDPAHENRGLFARLTEAQTAALACLDARHLFAMSALRATRLQSLASGWKNAGAPTPIGRTRWDQRLRERLRTAPGLWRIADRHAAVGPAERAFARLDRSGTGGAGGPIAIESRPRAEAMAGLVAERPHDGRIRLRRDASFLAWRYACTLSDYRFLYHGRGRLDGYLVLQRYRSAYGNKVRVNIVDCEARSDAVAIELVDALMRRARPAEIGTWREMFSPAVQARLEAHGLAPIDAHLVARGLPAVLVRAVDRRKDYLLGTRSLLEPRNWDLRMSATSLV